MKNKLFMLILLSFIIFIPLKVEAASHNVTVDCNHCDSYVIKDAAGNVLTNPIEDRKDVTVYFEPSYGYLWSSCTGGSSYPSSVEKGAGCKFRTGNTDTTLTVVNGEAYKFEIPYTPEALRFNILEGWVRYRTWGDPSDLYFAGGSKVYLTIRPKPGYILESVDGIPDGTIISNIDMYDITMPYHDVRIEPHFAVAPPAHASNNIITIGDANVTITSDKATAPVGETITLDLNFASGYELDTIYGIPLTKIGTNKYTFTMLSRDVTISVTSRLSPAGSSGTTGGSATIQAPSASLSGGSSLGTYNTSSVNNKKESEKKTYQVSVTQALGGSIILDNTSIKEGDTVTFKVEPAEGYNFKSLEGVTITKIDDETYSFTMPSNNIVLSPNFISSETTLYEITLKESQNGKVRLSTFKGEANEKIIITIEPDKGYMLDEIKGVEYTKETDNIYSFYINDNTTLEVTFKKIPFNYINIILISLGVILLIGITFVVIINVKKEKNLNNKKKKESKKNEK